MKRVLFRPGAVKDLDSVPARDRKQIESAIDRVAETGEGDIKMLAGPERHLRLRVGTGECGLRSNLLTRFASCTSAIGEKLTDR